jgi:uncharacterized surface protein with fasciclin (FAS1) repeats
VIRSRGIGVLRADHGLRLAWAEIPLEGFPMRKKLAVIGLTAVLGVSALGGSATSSAAPTAPEKNIVQTAVAAGQFTTLVSLVKKAGLAGTLSGKGPYTVFAPTDAAFAKVPKATLAALGKDKAALKSVLLYHVVKGSVPASKVVTLTSAKTLDEGKTVKITVTGKTVKVNGAKVVTADIKTSNGIIHVIDKVLIPSGM